MNLRFLLLPSFLLVLFTASGQAVEEKEIMKPITALFTGMATGDSALIHKQFDNVITMATVFKNREGKTVVRRENSLDGFLKAVAGEHEPFNEPIWNVKIQVDGDLALVSCDYAFYLGKTFSHCGIDAFQLVKGETGWKIFHLVDTRRKDDCVIPDDVQAKFK